MSVPNYERIVHQLKEKHPQAWTDAHTGNAHTEDFVRLVAAYLHELDPNVALNGKRGNPNDISDDALNILDPIDGPGRTPDGRRCWVVDFIGNAGSTDPRNLPRVVWNAFSDPVASSGANVIPGLTPPTPQMPVQPYPDEKPNTGWWDAVFTPSVRERYIKAGRVYPDNDRAFRWASRTAYDIRDGLTKEESLAKHLKELEQELGLTP